MGVRPCDKGSGAIDCFPLLQQIPQPDSLLEHKIGYFPIAPPPGKADYFLPLNFVAVDFFHFHTNSVKHILHLYIFPVAPHASGVDIFSSH